MENIQDNKEWKAAEIMLSYRNTIQPSMRPKISGSRDAYNVLMASWDMNKIEMVEQFRILLTNRANKVLGVMDVSTGGISGTMADPKIIFVSAIKALASGIILAHNHPSGNLNPSQNDIDLTKRLKTAGKLLDIDILDHLIITSEGYFSFADQGLM